MAEMAPQRSPYRYGFNNPVNVTDPDGNFEYTDGYGSYSSFGATGAVEFSGAYGGENGDCPEKPCGGGNTDPTPWYLKWLEPILIGNHIIGDAINKANGRFDTSPEENVLAGTNYLIDNAVMFQTMSSIFGGKPKTKIPLKNGNVGAVKGVDAVGGVIVKVKNSPYLIVQKGDKTFHISPDRVKEFVKNPLNPNSRWGDQIDFKKYGVPKDSKIIQGAGKGHKRTPTVGELEMFNNFFKK